MILKFASAPFLAMLLFPVLVPTEKATPLRAGSSHECADSRGCKVTLEGDVASDACAPYLDIEVITQSSAKCKCQDDPDQEGEEEICLLDLSTNCAFNVSITVNVPAGHSAKGPWGSTCKPEGSWSATQLWGGSLSRPNGCNAVKTATIDIYNAPNCVGTVVCSHTFKFECSPVKCDGTCPGV